MQRRAAAKGMSAAILCTCTARTHTHYNAIVHTQTTSVYDILYVDKYATHALCVRMRNARVNIAYYMMWTVWCVHECRSCTRRACASMAFHSGHARKQWRWSRNVPDVLCLWLRKNCASESGSGLWLCNVTTILYSVCEHHANFQWHIMSVCPILPNAIMNEI